MESRVIAIANQKGGVGKTSTTINLGTCLAASGRKTLLIDLDPQANLTCGLGLNDYQLKKSIYNILIEPNAEISSAILPTKYNRLNLVPSHNDLFRFETETVHLHSRDFRLKRSLKGVLHKYDFILVDCPPTLSVLMAAALATANEVIITIQAQYFALVGLDRLLAMIKVIKEEMNQGLTLTGVLVTMYDVRTKESLESLKDLQSHLKIQPKLFNTIIRVNSRIVQSQRQGVPVIYYDKNCRGAKAYMALAQEVIDMKKLQGRHSRQAA